MAKTFKTTFFLVNLTDFYGSRMDITENTPVELKIRIITCSSTWTKIYLCLTDSTSLRNHVQESIPVIVTERHILLGVSLFS